MDREKFAEWTLRVVAFTCLGLLGLMAAFIFAEGYPALRETGFLRFIGGTKWAPSKGSFGVLPMIVGTGYVTLGAMAVGLPIGLGSAIFISEFAPERTGRTLKTVVEFLAGIPSVVFGFVGLMMLVPFVRERFGGPGFSVAAASLVLGIMILPTVVSISYDALRAVPEAYREGMVALGASKWQALRMAILPAAKPGILAATVLAMGRAVGETMAVIMVAGNATVIPVSPLDPVRTLTSNIALEMGYAAGLHRQALFACGIVLFVLVGLLDVLARSVMKKR